MIANKLVTNAVISFSIAYIFKESPDSLSIEPVCAMEHKPPKAVKLRERIHFISNKF